MPHQTAPDADQQIDEVASRHATAAAFFEHWPSSLTPAEATLRAQLQSFATFGAMLYVYVLHRGKVFKAAPYPRDIARNAVKRQCFCNAAQLATEFPDRFVYVEGYALSAMATAHAWCVTHDGTVVDPTWENPEECAYVGIPFDLDFVTTRVLETGYWGIFGEMPQRQLLLRPVEEMVHELWREEIAARKKWPALEAVLSGTPEKNARSIRR
ncbi:MULTISPECIES: hypothetical protein [unclassified Variovorax]|uniref:hypothetical protein n=1 Tax=unclassified Variovorax TaxID=663243 RepID=UPI00076D4718|nr:MULTISPECIES: hypothetical protein [unclassified Variovorax]KWT95553.1 hypothetical protein APY03_2430 [Variovorax sp. WDL1]PNG50160.1 hypothetical protein CHC06_05783 [Variovorax sp. B2]PNG51033.1 hypothetical protein CHC07_05689 [Variovorax sp. B4]VTV17206.1 hypothetical protein WDL1P1_00199 [Variovorax sp. WDL1]